MKTLSKILSVIAVVLSYVMCIEVAYNYGTLLHCRECSAPAYVAFFSIIPYAVVILILLVISFIIKRKQK